MSKKGKVYLVGAGPGDVGLITVKGLRCIREADTILYDRLVEPQLLTRANEKAELIYVGKESGKPALAQEETNAILVAKALEGKIVTRLKGGDPFVLGRGAEEAEALAKNNIPFEVVPGVSAATAVPAYAGIPLTHRKLASSFAVITGQETPDKEGPGIAWDRIATAVDTLVFLMGMENLKLIVEKLIKYGRPPSTPVALIRWGTLPRQHTLVGTLGDIVAKVEAADFRPPAVIIVGDVVTLHQHLKWFTSKPLFGKRVLVTRPRHQANKLIELLAQEGAEPIELPVIEITPPPSWADLDSALGRLSDYDWIIFTSTNGVDAFFKRLYHHHWDARQLAGTRVCSIGKATATELEKHGIRADLIPGEYSSSGIISSLKYEQVKGARFLLPRSEIADRMLVEGLLMSGAQVDQVTAYNTIVAPERNSSVKQLFQETEVDIVTFTSPSTVQGLIASLQGERELLQNAVIACIGPVTAKAAEEAGLKIDVMAKEHTMEGLVRALVEHETPRT